MVGSAPTLGRKSVMAKALSNVHPSHLLDTKLFDFAALQRLGIATDDEIL